LVPHLVSVASWSGWWISDGRTDLFCDTYNLSRRRQICLLWQIVGVD
jgi:hypothetical protein